MESIIMMIGGQALKELGSDRYTDDTDWARFEDGKRFVERTSGGEIIDLAYLGGFGKDIWKSAKPVDGIADPQTLAELKARALMEHLRQGNWKKVASDEYDLQFLGREYGVLELPIFRRHFGDGPAREAEVELRAHIR